MSINTSFNYGQVAARNTLSFYLFFLILEIIFILQICTW